jgi:hypothetical protein
MSHFVRYDTCRCDIANCQNTRATCDGRHRLSQWSETSAMG